MAESMNGHPFACMGFACQLSANICGASPQLSAVDIAVWSEVMLEFTVSIHSHHCPLPQATAMVAAPVFSPRCYLSGSASATLSAVNPTTCPKDLGNTAYHSQHSLCSTIGILPQLHWRIHLLVLECLPRLPMPCPRMLRYMFWIPTSNTNVAIESYYVAKLNNIFTPL